MSDPLQELERRWERLAGRAQERHAEALRLAGELAQAREFLTLAPKAQETLEQLGHSLFGEVLDEVEAGLSLAIAEILGQNRRVGATRSLKSGRLAIDFHITQDGRTEDILSGQGGSVCNILSVSLRLIALSRLDPGHHRPFLVLDEQDCWLRPDLVPRFMGVIRAVAERLGLQVLVISHHPLDLFADHAARVYALLPTAAGPTLTCLKGCKESA